MRYTTIQNWSKNVYNLVTKRTVVDEEGIMEWVDGNLGSKVTISTQVYFERPEISGRGALYSVCRFGSASGCGWKSDSLGE